MTKYQIPNTKYQIRSPKSEGFLPQMTRRTRMERGAAVGGTVGLVTLGTEEERTEFSALSSAVGQDDQELFFLIMEVV